MNHGLDTDTRVCFYEQEFYMLSNFSAFRVLYHGIDFDTAEHAYHYMKFNRSGVLFRHVEIRNQIRYSRSAHLAFQIAQEHKNLVPSDWDEVKFDIMRDILRAKVSQHEYVARKLLETGDRELVENSWRDDVWGWGEKQDGRNMLGKLWMEVRKELRERQQSRWIAFSQR